MTNEPKAGKGLDPEMLAAYIDNRLPPEQRASVEAQLANDPDSYAVLVETMKALDEGNVPDVRPAPVTGVSPTLASGGNSSLSTEAPSAKVEALPGAAVLPMRPRGLKTRWVVAGTLLAAAAALAMVVWLQPEVWQRIRGGEPVDPLMAKLVEAVGEERYIEARLTGGFKYGPLVSPNRAAAGLSQQNLQLLSAAGDVQKLHQSEPTADSWHRWGLAQLLLRDNDEAIDSLERAANLGPTAAILSDLSAAYLARSPENGAEDLGRALATSQRATQLNSSLAEAWFNRALVQGRMGLADGAEESWRRFLELETDPAWRAEADRQRQRVGTKDQSDMTPVRERVEGELLARWSAAAAIGDSVALASANDELEQAAAIAEAAGRDRYLANVVADLKSSAVPLTQRSTDVASLAAALSLSARDQNQLVGPTLEPAMPSLCQWSSALCASGRLAIAVATGVGADAVRYRAHLDDVARLVEPSDYLALQGMVLWRAGLSRLREGDYEYGLAAYQRAFDRFVAAGELSNAANMQSLSAEAFRALGDRRATWQHHEAALSFGSAVTRRVRHQVLAQVALSCLAIELPECAIVTLADATVNAEKWGQPSAILMVHLHRARAFARVEGASAGAVNELGQAASVVSSLADPNLQSRAQAELASAAAEVIEYVDDPKTLESVERGIAAFEKFGAANRAAALRLAKGRALVRGGRLLEARTEFETGIRHLQRVALSATEASRTTALNPLAALVLEVASLELSAGQDDSALALVEHARRLSTGPDSGSAEVGMALSSLAAIRAGLDANTSLIYLAPELATPSAWVVSRKQVWRYSLPIEKAGLSRLVRNYREAARVGDRDALEQANQSVSKALLPTDPALLAATQYWVFVPDALTAGLGLGALTDTEGAPLFANKIVSIAPSGAMFVRRGSGATSVRAAFLAFGGSAGSGFLPTLPNVKAEAEAAATNYPSAQVYLDSQATSANLFRALRGADIVHVSAHAIARGENAGLSRLLLAPGEDGSSGFVYAGQVAALDGILARVVILAGCRTGYSGTAATANGEGVLSIAGAFLRAGVLQVVASVWDVPDAETKNFMTAFHRHLAESGNASRALATTQRELSNDPRTRAVVGAFQVYGS